MKTTNIILSVFFNTRQLDKADNDNHPENLADWLLQGPPYLLPRCKMAILSKCAHDFQKNFS